MLGMRAVRVISTRTGTLALQVRTQTSKAASRVEAALLDAKTGPFPALDAFAHRHIGPTKAQVAEMLKVIKEPSLDAMIVKTMPKTIRGTRSKMCVGVDDRRFRSCWCSHGPFFVLCGHTCSSARFLRVCRV